MKWKLSNLFVFVCSAVCFLITVHQFYNMGIYADEYNTSPAVVLGGEFWLYMDWLKLFALFALTVVSAVKLLKEKKE